MSDRAVSLILPNNGVVSGAASASLTWGEVGHSGHLPVALSLAVGTYAIGNWSPGKSIWVSYTWLDSSGTPLANEQWAVTVSYQADVPSAVCGATFAEGGGW